ncbi:MAG: LamG domain-containing protein, partial [Lentisphaerae bacterium]|nr:LamG domain-containing protein [Lentisphaerota bacterium]
QDLIYGTDVNHLDISGLDFRFTTPAWDLTVVAWDFRTKPWSFREDAHPACIRVWGKGTGIRIANCRFRDVVFPIRLRALNGSEEIDDVLIEDNEILNADGGVVSVTGGSGWGFARRHGRIGDVRVFRNRSHETGMRPSRYGNGTAMNFGAPRTLHVAGNVIERSGAQGINVVGGKSSGMWGDVPFTRVLIHQNKVWQSMLYCNDYGGIEAWQSGPIYIFNNLSHDARGMWAGRLKMNGSSPGFGHAYYLDGGFKNYLFNNIAWGRSNDPTTKLVNCSAFQEIHSFQNEFFNNTAYNYYVGSRRQSPGAGRNKYLGNIWQSISNRVFRHAEPAKTAADGNAHHAGPQKKHFHYETNAYARNVFHDIAEVGVFETSGRWLKTPDSFRAALKEHESLACDVGLMTTGAPLRDPANGDFRLRAGSIGVDHGARVFVPWALSGVVGEWHFYPAGNDSSRIIDEHWYMADYYTDRGTYHSMPRYPLMVHNVEVEDYIDGELENWGKGALEFSSAKRQYAVASDAQMEKPITFKARRKSRHEGAKPETCTISGEDLKTPQVHRSNMLIELYVRVKPGSHGILVSKREGAGYGARVNKGGCAEFAIQGESGEQASVTSGTLLADGQWHHLIAEADRSAGLLTLYLDGRKDATASGLGPTSLANDADLCVGGSPTGECIDAAFDFLRIAHGTLADARTTVEELYAWQFDGPQFRDFSGARPLGKGRDAGAIESQ